MFKAAAKKVLTGIPVTAELLRQRRIRKFFPEEWRLFRGKSRSRSSQPSVILFTLHKVASVYTRKIFMALARDSGLTFIDYDLLVFGGELRAEEADRIYNRPSPELYPPTGYCFAPVRAWHSGIPDITPYRIVLMLRDPRDVLVSHYFSALRSHSVPMFENSARDTLMRERDMAAHLSIDEYVLEQSEQFLIRCQQYVKHVYGKPNVLFVTYEEMIADFPSWLRKVVEHTGLEVRPETLEQLVSAAKFKVSSEDPSKHIRQITPGDHRRKLQPETIAALTERFGDVLDRLGYPR